MAWVMALAACAPPEAPEAAGMPARSVRLAQEMTRAHLRSRAAPANGLEVRGRVAFHGSEGDFEPLEGAVTVPVPRLQAVGPDAPTSPYTTGARSVAYDMTLGTALAERLADFPRSQVDQYGVSLLTSEELFGADDEEGGLCENPFFDWTFRDGGVSWNARALAVTYQYLADDLSDVYSELPAECDAALRANGGDIEAAVAAGDCQQADVLGHFPAGSECRACVEEGGDHEGCVAAGHCERDAPAWTWVGESLDGSKVGYYRMVSGFMLACAPDWITRIILLYTPTPGGQLPRYWDKEGWAYLCAPINFGDEIGYTCIPGQGGPKYGSSLAKGAWSIAEYITEEGHATPQWTERRLYVDSFTMKAGYAYYQNWESAPGNGNVSGPVLGPDDVEDPFMVEAFGSWQGFGWGLDPYSERPDGEDRARDFLAALTLKTTTSINGILVGYMNHDRCDPASWTPLSNGRSHCGRLLPREEGWSHVETLVEEIDGEEHPFPMTMMTLGSSGKSDPDVPGGFAIGVYGTPYLEKLEGCVYPHTIEPDVVETDDDSDEPERGHALVGHTYRFGKDALDVVGTMYTARPREFCPGGP